MEHYFSNENQRARESTYRFAAFALNPAERTLHHAGVLVPLQPKAFDTLLLLVERAERLVTKQELLDALWPSLSVSEANLTNTIVTLRKVLGKSAIRTVSKYGYRFEVPLRGEPNIASLTYERFARAKELISLRRLDSVRQARELLWICLAEDPSLAPAWAWLGRCSAFLGKLSNESASSLLLADMALRRAFTIDPDCAVAHQFYTHLQVDTGHAAEAMGRLVDRLQLHPHEPESLASLVQVFRFQGMLDESLLAHKRARELDPAATSRIAHSLFLAGDYMGTIETYSGHGAFYLDAAAWASMGERQRAVTMLRERLIDASLSPLLTALLGSLLAALEGNTDLAIQIMQQADTSLQPEVLIYFARHYGFLGEAQLTMHCIERALQAGFVCPPETLALDTWLDSLRSHRGMVDLSNKVKERVAHSRSTYKRQVSEASMTNAARVSGG